MHEDVFCSVCGWRWDMYDPGVTRWWSFDEWACTDESACFGRRAALSLERDYAQAAAKTAGEGTGDGLG